jgi:phosphate transport system substrate-binding protein
MLKKIAAIAIATLMSTQVYAGEATGAGSSFFFPLASKWANDYSKKTGNRINYQSVGSSAGVKQLDNKTVVFAATDVPMKPEDLDKKNQVQFPMVGGEIVIAVNVAGVDKINLSVDVIAKIYADKIKKWNDKEIADLNPSAKLPDLPIIKVRRSDGSGTTWNFTKFLADSNESWKKEVGFGSTVEWPGNTVGAKGNDGVASNVQQTNGTIGYVELSYAKQNKLTVAAIPTSIVATVYAVMYKTNDDPAAAKQAIDFFSFCLASDQQALDLDYKPLSPEKKAEVSKVVSQIK